LFRVIRGLLWTAGDKAFEPYDLEVELKTCEKALRVVEDLLDKYKVFRYPTSLAQDQAEVESVGISRRYFAVRFS
jgi:hypothetical protein